MKKIAGVLVFSVLVGGYAGMLLNDAGFFRKITPVAFGECKARGKMNGPEDMALLKNGTVVISADPRDEHFQGLDGGLYLYDLKSFDLVPFMPEQKLAFPFHPHGIDVLETAEKTILYVINHRSEEDTVIEVFQIQDHKITYVKTIQDPLFQSGNDIVATSEDHFYLSSDFGTTKRWQQKLTQYLRYPTGYVSYFDGSKAAKVIAGVFYGNGLTFDGDKKTLFVAGMLGKSIGAYDISSGRPKHLRTISVDGAPDNILWKDGKLFVAAHPNLLALKAESENRQHKAPTQILVLDDRGKSEVLYENDGQEISSASGVLPISDQRILIGSVFDDHILDCQR